MAVISKIRSKSGLLITVIGVAMALFVAGDLLNSGQSLFVQRSTDVAIIGGKKISYENFESRIREQIGDQNVDQETRELVRQRVWNQLQQEYVYGKEYDLLGLSVSGEELFDQIKNTQPGSILYQYFTNPQTGRIYDQFQDPNTGGLNTTTVLAYANQLISQDQTENWLPIEKAVKQDRIQTKYNKLIEKGIYPTTLEVKNDQNEKNTFLRVSYVSKFYRDLLDSEIPVDEAELKKFYNQIKTQPQYQQEDESRAVEYVEFYNEPSAQDVNEFISELSNLKESFSTAENDTIFANRYSDGNPEIAYLKQNEINPLIDSAFFYAENGSVFGPYQDQAFAYLTKKAGFKSSSDSVKARHILLPIANNDTAAALQKADSIKNEIRRSKNFEAMATQFSEDLGSAQQGGDLGYFTEGMMVKPFNDACFNGQTGEMPIVVSQFGVHLIEITDKTTPKQKGLFVTIKREILPSKATTDEIYNQASAFSIQNNEQAKFTEAAASMNLRKAQFIKKSDTRVNDLEASRELVRWAFQNEVGAVSEPMEFGNRFVVACLVESREAGTQDFENVKDQVTAEYIREKKAEKFMAEMQGATDLSALASKLGTDVKSIAEVQYSAFSIPGIGPEYNLLGKMFGAPIGTISQPVKDKIGVYVFKVEQTSDKATFKDDLATRSELARNVQSKLNFGVFEALKQEAKIQDNRSDFY